MKSEEKTAKPAPKACRSLALRPGNGSPGLETATASASEVESPTPSMEDPSIAFGSAAHARENHVVRARRGIFNRAMETSGELRWLVAVATG